MLKLFKQYKYALFCSLSVIILTQLKGVSLFWPTGYGAIQVGRGRFERRMRQLEVGYGSLLPRGSAQSPMLHFF